MDSFRQLTHVTIHGDVFRAIMDKWYIEDYVGDGMGTTGYGNNYNHVYFADVVASIPEYIRRLKAHYADYDSLAAGLQAGPGSAAGAAAFRRLYSGPFEWNDPCMAGRWMHQFKNVGESMPFTLIDVNDHVRTYAEAGKWDELSEFAKEVLTAYWINAYMSHTRKHWTQTVGKGSQSNDPLGYAVLAEAVQGILAAEAAEHASWELDNEDESETEAENAQSSAG